MFGIRPPYSHSRGFVEHFRARRPNNELWSELSKAAPGWSQESKVTFNNIPCTASSARQPALLKAMNDRGALEPYTLASCMPSNAAYNKSSYRIAAQHQVRQRFRRPANISSSRGARQRRVTGRRHQICSAKYWTDEPSSRSFPTVILGLQLKLYLWINLGVTSSALPAPAPAHELEGAAMTQLCQCRLSALPVERGA